MLDPRRAPAGTVYGYTDTEGNQVELAAELLEGPDDADDPAGEDGYWYVRPRNLVEVSLLDGHDLPVARKVLAIDRADAEAKAAEKAERKAARKADGPLETTNPIGPEKAPTPSDTPASDGGSV